MTACFSTLFNILTSLLIHSYSPLGLRCEGIHDPRVRHDEEHLVKVDRYVYPQKSTTLTTDIHIDYQHATKISETIYGGPFGANTAAIQSSFKALSAAICNSDDDARPVILTQSQRTEIDARPAPLTKSQRLEIAISMASTRPVLFVFKNSHVLYGRYLCMCRQSKVFKTENGKVKEIPGEQGLAFIRDKTPGYISVSEIAFDQKVRKGGKLHSPALWFNIPLQAMQEADMMNIRSLSRMKAQEYFAVWHNHHYDSEPPFRIFYARGKVFYPGAENDSTWHEFMSEILRHNLSQLQNTNGSSEVPNGDLECHFNSFRHVLEVDRWPANEGTENRRRLDAVPGVEDRYSVSLMKDKQRLWEAFVTAPWEDRTSPSNSLAETSKDRSRLCSFVALSEGQSLPEDAISSRCQLPFVVDENSCTFWNTWNEEWNTVIELNRQNGNHFE